MPNLEVKCIEPQSVCFYSYRLCYKLRAPGPEKFIWEGPPVLGNFETSTPNLVH